jgi:glucokinase
MTGSILAGVDVGGSKVAVLLTDRELTPIARHTVATGVGDPDAAVDQVADAIITALRSADRVPADLAAIGIGVPGRVDPLAGVVTLAVNLGWHEVALGPGLEQRFAVPVAVENDVKAAAAGLASRGRTDGVIDLAYLGIGTGISAGVVLGGRLYRGSRGLAGEIGHVVLQEDGPTCECGLHGCFEAMASGRGIASLAEAAHMHGDARLSAADVYRAAAEGDPIARGIVGAAGRAVARAVHLLVMTYDLQAVFIGGGVASAGALFSDPVQHGLDALREQSPLAREALGPGIVHVLPPDAEAGAWGAVVLANNAVGPVDDGTAMRGTTSGPAVAADHPRRR